MGVNLSLLLAAVVIYTDVERPDAQLFSIRERGVRTCGVSFTSKAREKKCKYVWIL